MNSLLGQMFVLLGLGSAVFGAVLAFVAGASGSLRLRVWAQNATYVFALAMLAANGVMVWALLQHDFSVGYVAQVGSRSTPPLYTVVSLWSSLEGSILFWGLVLGVYATAFVVTNRQRHPEYMGYAIGTILVVASFFMLLIAAPANPFLPVFPVPEDGPGPNALLQNHPLMVIHPPMLYLGYVGMTIPFGIAIAALLQGKLSWGWLKVLRQYTLIPWAFLSVGIVLGSWWAYEVLGWGGYWAWDPVENASFLPWLAATGYLHSTILQERKRMLKAWTLTLVICSFLLTILGTFMTRSGVFNSVHSFTQSAIGPVLLVFFGVVTILSLGLLAARTHLLDSEGRIQALLSREVAFVLNNILFVTFTFTVLLGTVYPLLTEAITDVKVSVGEPYFNRMAVPLGLLMVFLMGVGPVLPWGQGKRDALLRNFVWPLGVGLLLVAVALWQGVREPLVLLTFGLCGFAAWVTLRELVAPIRLRLLRKQESIWQAVVRGLQGDRRRMGGYVVHLAILMIVAAIAASQSFRQSQEASLAVGETMHVGQYSFTYLRAAAKQEPHRLSLVAQVEVVDKGHVLGMMEPKLNFYHTQREPIGTPHVVTLGNTDLYMSLLSVDKDGAQVGLKVYLIPAVAWLWRSLPLLVLGSAISLWPRNQRKLAVEIASTTVAKVL